MVKPELCCTTRLAMLQKVSPGCTGPYCLPASIFDWFAVDDGSTLEAATTGLTVFAFAAAACVAGAGLTVGFDGGGGACGADGAASAGGLAGSDIAAAVAFEPVPGGFIRTVYSRSRVPAFHCA